MATEDRPVSASGETLEERDDLLHRREPPRGVLGAAVREQPSDHARRSTERGRDKVALDHLAEAVLIAARVWGRAVLGRRVARRHRARARLLGFARAALDRRRRRSDAEVGESRLLAVIDQDVARLDVEVKEVLLVDVGEPARDPEQRLDQLAPRALMVSQPATQRAAAIEGHHDEGRVSVSFVAVDIDDIRVHVAALRARFVEQRPVARASSPEHLQRDKAIERGLVGLVDDAEAARVDTLEHRVRAQLRGRLAQRFIEHHVRLEFVVCAIERAAHASHSVHGCVACTCTVVPRPRRDHEKFVETLAWTTRSIEGRHAPLPMQ